MRPCLYKKLLGIAKSIKHLSVIPQKPCTHAGLGGTCMLCNPRTERARKGGSQDLSPEALAQLGGSRPMRNSVSKNVASVVRVTLEVVLQSPQTCKRMNIHISIQTHKNK